LAALAADRGLAQLLMQPGDNRAGILFRRARLALGRHLPTRQLVEDPYPGRRHVVVIKRHGQLIEPEATLLNLGAVTGEAVLFEERQQPPFEGIVALRGRLPGVRHQDGQRFHHETDAIAGHY
jgi:hypothetical protein